MPPLELLPKGPPPGGPPPRDNLRVSGQKMELQQRPSSKTPSPKKPKQKTKQSNKSPQEVKKTKEELEMEKLRSRIMKTAKRENYNRASNEAFRRSQFMGY